MKIEEKICQIKLTKSEQKVMDFIMVHKEEACYFTSSELAEFTRVSGATVIRLANKLGFSRFSQFKKELQAEVMSQRKEFVDIQSRLRELKIIGKVSVSGTVYAGAKIFVRDVKDEIRTDIKSVTFFYENGFVRRGKYEAPDTNITKQVLDGYSSN